MRVHPGTLQILAPKAVETVADANTNNSDLVESVLETDKCVSDTVQGVSETVVDKNTPSCDFIPPSVTAEC